jgi:hypothetical protein
VYEQNCNKNFAAKSSETEAISAAEAHPVILNDFKKKLISRQNNRFISACGII